jgi:hypothetical protein
MPKISIELPKMITCESDEEIEYISDLLTHLTNKEVKYCFIRQDKEDAVYMLYTGNKPNHLKGK